MHIPVLLQEVVEGLAPKRGEVILDATVGGGGHSEALCVAMGGEGTIVCLDEDEDAIERSRERLTSCGCRFLFSRTNFRNLDIALASFGIAEVNRAIADLGLSSFQLEESRRGFSFQSNEPLRMTFRKEGADLDAETIVNEWSEETLRTILHGYADESNARRIAGAIVEARGRKRIVSSKELADIILKVVHRRGKIHPATKTFQALRIAVNDEFRALEEALPKMFASLSNGGRLAVISFHSMEDRMVKRYFKELEKQGVGKVQTKRPQVPTDTEMTENPRSRSAKLRIIEKCV